MASGNRPLKAVPVYLPEPLWLILKRYQDDRLLPSFNALIIELLETHPAVVQRIEMLYSDIKSL